MTLEARSSSPEESNKRLPMVFLTPFQRNRIVLLNEMLGQIPDFEEIVRTQGKFDLTFDTGSGSLHISVDKTFLRGLRSVVLSFYMDLQNEGMGDVAEKLVSPKTSTSL